MLKRFFTQPLFFGLCYVGSIPAYAWLYVTYGCLKGAVRPDWYDAVYLSVVTVTTLGYGDLVPQPESDMTKVLVSTQALFGVVMIGLFLNALSKQSTQRSQEAASRAIDALRGAVVLPHPSGTAKVWGRKRLRMMPSTLRTSVGCTIMRAASS